MSCRKAELKGKAEPGNKQNKTVHSVINEADMQCQWNHITNRGLEQRLVNFSL